MLYKKCYWTKGIPGFCCKRCVNKKKWYEKWSTWRRRSIRQRGSDISPLAPDSGWFRACAAGQTGSDKRGAEYCRPPEHRLYCCQMLIGHVVVILRSYQFSPQAIKKDIGFCALLFTNLFCSSALWQRTKYLCKITQFLSCLRTVCTCPFRSFFSFDSNNPLGHRDFYFNLLQSMNFVKNKIQILFNSWKSS